VVFGVQGLRFRVWGVGFRVQSSRIGIQGWGGCRIHGVGFRVLDLRLGFRADTGPQSCRGRTWPETQRFRDVPPWTRPHSDW
jgi:hypothetical protein